MLRQPWALSHLLYLGVDTASDTLKLSGLGEDKLLGLHIPIAPSIPPASVFPFWKRVLFILLTSQEEPKGHTVCGSSSQPANVLD